MLIPFARELADCRSAQREWARISTRDRLKPMRELRYLMVDHLSELTSAIAADIGRPAADVIASDLLPAAAALKFLEQRAQQILAPRRIPKRLRPTWLFGCRDVVYRRPWGVVGIIGTWNYPVYLNLSQIAQALTAGNGVMWKPSEFASNTASVLHKLILEAGWPAHLFTLLPSTREAGKELAQVGADYIVFTGSDAVGRSLAAQLGKQLTPSTLELSGCDAMFVLDDADIALAARAAWFGVTLNRGQTCIAVRRIFVQRTGYIAFVEELRKLIPNDKPIALVSPGQITQADQLVADGIACGAKPLHLEGKQSGLNYPTTFLIDAQVSMAVCREASFAPLAAVIPFDTVEEALALAAESPFGLAASIFTKDTARGAELASRVGAGMVAINDVLAPTAHPATPFGGRGSSGWGVTQGMEGLLSMTTPQSVTIRNGTFRPHFDEAVKPNPSTLNILQGLMRATHGRRWRERLRGMWELVKGVKRQG